MTKQELDNEEQKAFESWYYRVCPHGDCDSVHEQWLQSYEYLEFCDQFDGEQ